MRDETAFWKGMTWIIVAYVVALVIGLIAGRTVSHADPLWIALTADIAATVAIFGFSVAFRNSSFYDAYWSVAPIAIVGYWAIFVGADGNFLRQALVLGAVAFWGTRLTTNWAIGWHGLHHEDWRYVDLQHTTGPLYWLVSFAGLHMMPTLIVFLGLWPAYLAVISPTPANALDFAAAAVAVGATFLEAGADSQLRAFRKRPPQQAAVMQEGLWNLSRHPNYFGEITFWFSLWLFAIAADPAYAYTIVGTVAMAALFRFISIPMMEKRQVARRPGYARYQARVSMLVPWFSQPADRADLELGLPQPAFRETAHTDAIGNENVRLTLDTLPFIPPPGEE